MSNCVLEQLTEVATVTNHEGITEDLFILHPPKPAGMNEEKIQTKTTNSKPSMSTDADNNDSEYKASGSSGKTVRSWQERPGKSVTTSTTPSKAIGQKKEELVEDNQSTALPETSGRGRPNKILPLYAKDYKGYPCEQCGKVFTLKGNLKVHIRVHTEEKPFSCNFPKCDKSFRGKDILAKHMMAHSGIKPFECSVCHKGFSSKNSMIEHEARHTDSKPYQCKQCGQTFRQFSCLSRHYMVHREEYPHQCTVCSKRFKAKVYVTSHMKVHTGIAPYQCKTCSKRFKHQSDLNRHTIIHTGIKPYACSLCGSKFSDISARKRHEREHDGQKPFECKLCGENFKRQAQLKTHMLRKHSAKGELSSSDTALLFADPSTQQQLAVLACPASQPTTPTLPVKHKIEKRMITHHVAVPKVKGKAAGVDPVALLEHIKDQLDPSQMPQTVDGQPIQVSCKVIEQNKLQQVVELQYLSTVRVPCEDIQDEAVQNTVSISNIAEQVINSVDCNTNIGVITGDIDLNSIQEGNAIAMETEDENSVQCKVEILPVQDTNNSTVQQLDTISHSEPFVTLQIDENTNQQTINSTNQDCNSQAGEIKLSPLKTENPNQVTSSQSQDIEKSILTSSLTEKFVCNPEFSNQEYYNWLSAFADACKMVNMPLETQLFEKISNVNKKLADMMANPKGVLANKSNFIISMSISKELSSIIDRHLTYVLTALDNDN